jgi:hypothetical protein
MSDVGVCHVVEVSQRRVGCAIGHSRSLRYRQICWARQRPTTGADARGAWHLGVLSGRHLHEHLVDRDARGAGEHLGEPRHRLLELVAASEPLIRLG